LLQILFRRAAIASIIATFVLGAFVFSPAYDLYRRHQFWGDAEATAEELRRVVFQLDAISESSVRAELATEQFADLRALEVKIPLHAGELIWFRANEMFNVGLDSTGRILWMTDGQRASE
jgi:hypothetical protein